MRLSECGLCHRPVRVVVIHTDTDDELRDEHIKVDPVPSLHGWIQVLNLSTGLASYTDRGPNRYRPHYETCKGPE